MKTDRVPVEQSSSLRVAAPAGEEAARRERTTALRVTSLNHFVCTVCGRTLMTGEHAHRDSAHGTEAQVICELCRRQSTGKS